MKVIVLICVCLALGPGAASAAAAGWLEPEDVSKVSESITRAPEIALDPAGNAVAIGVRDLGGIDTQLEAIERPAGGAWSDSDVLSDPDEEQVTGFQVGIDAAGNAVAVWSAFHDIGYSILTASRPAGGEWSQPEFLTADASISTTPHLAVNADGDAVATWVELDGGEFLQEVVASVRPAGGEWSDFEVVAPEADDENGGSPQVGIDAEGNATAVWQETDENVVRTASLPVGGDWTVPEDLSADGDNAGAPRIAVSAAGDAVAAWTVNDGGTFSLHAKTRPPGGDWSDQEDVSAAGEDLGEPALAIDSNGAVASWLSADGGEKIVRAAVRPAGDGEWSEPDDVSSPAQEFRSLALATNVAAGAIAIWTSFDGTTNFVQAAVRPPGGEWSEPDDLSDVGEDAGLANLAFDAAGNAIAIWGHRVGDGFVAEAAGYDFVAPRLDGLRIPANGTAGVPVSFAVSPFDVFPLAATNWTFGDGGPGANGNVVSHAFVAPGAYPVTVTAIDGGGNTSSQARTITIAPRPEPRRITLSLRIKRKSLRGLLQSGKLSVVAAVGDPASVTLKGRARLRVGQGKARKLVSIFETKTVRFGAAGERELQLTLTERGRNKLQSLAKVSIVIAGEANAGIANVASSTATKTLSNPKR